MANYGRGWGDGYGGQSPESIDAYQEQQEREAGQIRNTANSRPMNGAESIAAERKRQIEKEGWTPEHDAQHADGSLVSAAMAYLNINHGYGLKGWAKYMAGQKWIMHWPASWNMSWWKPKDKRADLVRAGALIAAEIDRIDALP